MEMINEKFESIFNDILSEYNELNELMSSVEIMSDHKLYNHYLRRFKNIEKISEKIIEYSKLKKDIEAMVELGQENISGEIQNEIDAMQERKDILFLELKQMYANGVSGESEKVEIEITSKEDNEFLDEISGLIENYARDNDCEFEIQTNNDNVVILISGNGIYKKFNILSGKIKKILRGQETFALVAVINKNENIIELKEEDLEIQTSKSSGAGGQHINKTESAVKIIHKPTGIFGECQDERSQSKNKVRAMERLIEKITQNNKTNAEKNEEKQRKEIKNKLFASTPVIVFDFDANKIIVNSNKTEYKLKDIFDNGINQIFDNGVV